MVEGNVPSIVEEVSEGISPTGGGVPSHYAQLGSVRLGRTARVGAGRHRYSPAVVQSSL